MPRTSHRTDTQASPLDSQRILPAFHNKEQILGSGIFYFESQQIVLVVLLQLGIFPNLSLFYVATSR